MKGILPRTCQSGTATDRSRLGNFLRKSNNGSKLGGKPKRNSVFHGKNLKRAGEKLDSRHRGCASCVSEGNLNTWGERRDQRGKLGERQRPPFLETKKKQTQNVKTENTRAWPCDLNSGNLRDWESRNTWWSTGPCLKKHKREAVLGRSLVCWLYNKGEIRATFENRLQ